MKRAIGDKENTGEGRGPVTRSMAKRRKIEGPVEENQQEENQQDGNHIAGDVDLGPPEPAPVPVAAGMFGMFGGFSAAISGWWNGQGGGPANPKSQ